MSLYSQPEDTLFGWYSEGTPTLEDYEQNGKYCLSGLAYAKSAPEARGTSFKEMKFNGETLED